MKEEKIEEIDYAKKIDGIMKADSKNLAEQE